MNKKKILLHNMTFDGIHSVPGVINYDQRGVVFAESGDTVVTHNKIDSDYIDYLHRLGYPTSEINFIDLSIEKNKTWDSIFHSPVLHEHLTRFIGNKEYELDVYIPTRHDGGLSQKFDLLHCNNYQLSEKYGTKSGFRLFMEEAGLPHAEGFRDLESVNDVRTAMSALFSKNYNKVVVKIDDGISGYGNLIVNKEEFENSEILTDEEFYREYMAPIRWDVIGKGVVEGWIENGYLSSSILLFVENGGYRVVCLQDQLLINGDKWAGCYYPSELHSSEEMRQQLEEIIEKSAQFLIEKNFWGYYSFDVLSTTTSEIYLIEANMRKIGSFYPRVFVDKVMEKNNIDTALINYVASDYTNTVAWKGKQFADLKEYLEPFLWDQTNSDRGILLYNVGALSEGGRFDFVAVSQDSLHDAKLLREEVMGKLEQY